MTMFFPSNRPFGLPSSQVEIQIPSPWPTSTMWISSHAVSGMRVDVGGSMVEVAAESRNFFAAQPRWPPTISMRRQNGTDESAVTVVPGAMHAIDAASDFGWERTLRHGVAD